jgi:hypothetical protein
VHSVHTVSECNTHARAQNALGCEHGRDDVDGPVFVDSDLDGRQQINAVGTVFKEGGGWGECVRAYVHHHKHTRTHTHLYGDSLIYVRLRRNLMY